jgi:hypothetical protein
MSDHKQSPAVAQFLDRADAAFEEYDQGYADADATIAVLRRHVDQLRALDPK